MRASLTLRLLAGVVLAELLLASGLVWAGIIFTRRQLRQAFDAALYGRLTSVAALVRYPESGSGLIFDATLLPPARDPRHPSFYQVRDARGALIANSFPAGVGLPPVPGGSTRRRERPDLPGEAMRYWRFRLTGAVYRGLAVSGVPILDTEENLAPAHDTLTVYYAAPMLDTDGEVAAAGVAIALTSLVLLVLSTLLAAGMIRRELHPLRELAQQAGAISPQNWTFAPGEAAASRPELQPLIQALERMLQRLHAGHQQQRAFMADAAHHLKTPVAILKSTLQSLLRRPRSGDEYRAAAQASLADVERLEDLLQRMLRLARVEQWAEDGQAPITPTALGATCAAALERVQPLASARGVELRARGLDLSAWVRADADDLELVWVNLLENAVQHSPAGSAVELGCELRSAAAEVRVRDRGPGIPGEELGSVFERFRRGAAAPPGGFGLGLAIARGIVQAYGGEIAAASPPGDGATFTVTLPLAPAPARSASAPVPALESR